MFIALCWNGVYSTVQSEVTIDSTLPHGEEEEGEEEYYKNIAEFNCLHTQGQNQYQRNTWGQDKRIINPRARTVQYEHIRKEP